MATVIILFGSVLGLVSGLTAYIGFDASLWSALLIWIGAGPLSALLVIVAGLRIHAEQAEESHPEVAELA